MTVAQLVTLADGSLPREHRVALEARVARSPRLAELLRSQRRALVATRAFSPPTPAGLERRVRTSAAPARRPRWALAGACAAATAVAGAIALSVSGDRRAIPDAVVAMSARPALAEPAPAPAGDGVLRRSFAGVTFPDWRKALDWRAIGARRGSVDGRATDTVYYRHTHHTVGYTVLAGRSLGLPSEGRRVERNGVTIQLFRDGPRTVAVFEREGRTCVLAGVVHREDTLVKLASWRADGALTF